MIICKAIDLRREGPKKDLKTGRQKEEELTEEAVSSDRSKIGSKSILNF